jgi:serine/threonine protein kinase
MQVDFGPRYRVLKRLGMGGFGEVFLVECLPLNHKAALKVLRPERATTDVAKLSFMREAEILIKIQSAHVAAFRDFGQAPGGEFFILTEYCRGVSLERYIERKGQVRVESACKILIQIADGMSAVQRAGYMHRDLKPRNIMLVDLPGYRRFVKLLDFGTAVLAANLSKNELGEVTLLRLATATRRYAPPEYIARGFVDASYDFYSVGVTAYEMLAGFDASENLSRERRFDPRTFEDRAPRLDQLVPDLVAAPSLVRIVHRCIDATPDRRPKEWPEFSAFVKRGLEEWQASQGPKRRGRVGSSSRSVDFLVRHWWVFGIVISLACAALTSRVLDWYW